MKRKLLALLLILALLVTLAACAQDPPEAENTTPPASETPDETPDTPDEPETPDESETPDETPDTPEAPDAPEQPAALLGDAADWLDLAFWELSEDELLARLDPAVWSVFTAAPTLAGEEMLYHTGTAFGEPVLLQVGTNNETGLVSALTFARIYYTAEIAALVPDTLAGLAEDKWSDLRLATEGGPAELAQWVLSCRAALDGLGASFEPGVRLHGEDAASLTAMFEGTMADWVASAEKSGNFLPLVDYPERSYTLPGGGWACIEASGMLLPDEDKENFRFTMLYGKLGLFADDYTDPASGRGRAELDAAADAYAYWVE